MKPHAPARARQGTTAVAPSMWPTWHSTHLQQAAEAAWCWRSGSIGLVAAPAALASFTYTSGTALHAAQCVLLRPTSNMSCDLNWEDIAPPLAFSLGAERAWHSSSLG